jgi:hypothetical protein
MRLGCGCGQDHTKSFRCDVHDAAVRRRDPTGTDQIRRGYQAELMRRYRKLRVAVRNMLIRDDVLGLNPVPVGSLKGMLRDPGQMQHQALAQASGATRIEVFNDWFRTAQAEIVRGPANGAWMDPYIARGYEKGKARARFIVRGAPPTDTIDAEKLATLQAAARIELKGICDAVAQQVARIVAAGLVSNMRGPALARMLTDRLDRVGVVRGRSLANTIVVRAHGTATLATFRAAGIKKVGVRPETQPRSKPVATVDGKPLAVFLRDAELVEILTAGDDDVCPDCEDLAGQTYDIDEAEGLIPAHPNCRCAFVPADDARFADPEEFLDPNL